MKKGVLIFAFLIAFILLGVVSVLSQSCSSSSQTIMKLYSPSNSHGALWDDGLSDGSLQLREYQYVRSYPPNIVFSKPSSNSLKVDSPSWWTDNFCGTTCGMGKGVVFQTFDKSFLDGNNISIDWETLRAGLLVNYPQFRIEIYDGEYDKTVSSDFPDGNYPLGGEIPRKGNGLLQTIESTQGTNLRHITNKKINLTNASLSKVTLMIYINDAWVQEAGSFTIYDLKIIDSNGNIIQSTDLSQNLNMEQTGTYGDYGTIGAVNNYNSDICYDKIFGVQGNGNHNGNNILWLNASSNSHSSVSQIIGYNVPVKYGDLSCTSRPNTCADDEKMAVALFDDTNSHITDPNYMPSGIVSWWRFDDGTANDWLGRNTGVNNGSTFVNSKIGKGLNLDGVNDYVKVNDANNLDLTTFTIETWFKLSRLPNDGEIFAVVGKGEGPDTTKYNYHLNIMKDTTLWNPDRTSATIHCVFEESSAADLDYNMLVDIDSSYVGRYVHVVCTLNGNSFKIYIDGVDKTPANIYDSAGNNMSNPPAGGLPVPTFTTAPVFIGADSCGLNWGACTAGRTGDFFPGVIDEVAIYNRSLTAAEVQHRYNMGMYEKKICCKSGAPVSGTYWSNMNNIKINRTDVNDEVKMNIENLGISSGMEINYTVYKTDGSGFLFIRWDKKIAQISGKDSAVWIANNGTGVFYFKAKVLGTEYSSENEPYGKLTVNDAENNKFPVVIMNKPDAESKHIVNSIIDFEQSSYDEDDTLKAIWNFGDGNITPLLNCNNYGNCNTTHKYNLNGVKTIRLTAKEMRSTRAQENSTNRRIFLYSQGINVFAVISKPDINQIDVPILGSVEFNASLSFVANCTLNTCPSPLPAEVSGCYDVTDTVEGVIVNLKCFDYPKTGINGIGISAGKYNLWFNWTFDEIPYNKIGNWFYNYTQVVGFSRNYAHPRLHPVSLIAGYEPF